MTGSAVAEYVPEEERALRGLELAERHFTPERREAVAKFLDIPAEDPALVPYLAWCASLNLSPIAGHVWLIPSKKKGKDGEEDRIIYKPAIGRDGLLHKARETKGKPGGYKGMTFDVVCERDTFEVTRTIDPTQPPQVLHQYASKPTEFAEGESPDRYRGRIIGAWACCYVDGEPPTFYYASLREHGRLRQVWAWNPEARKRLPLWRLPDGRTGTARDAPEGATPVQEWDGAWDYTSTMVLKAAQSYVLRIALGVTGVVPVDELRDPRELTGEDRGHDGDVWASGFEEKPGGFDFDSIPYEALRERLREAVENANAQDPYAWPPAKCEMAFTNRSEEQIAALIEQIERENDLRDQRAAAASGEEVVTDAVVVEDPPAEAETPAAGPDEHDAETQERIERLKHTLADLLTAKDEAEAGSEQMGQIAAEVDQVAAELRSLGVDPRSI